MDIIDNILAGLSIESTVFCRMELTSAWAFQKDPLKGAPFHIILSGKAVLCIPEYNESIALQSGDVIILPGGNGHEIKSSIDAIPIPFKDLLKNKGLEAWKPGMIYNSTIIKYGAEGDEKTSLISGIFGFGDRRENPLLAALPRLFHLQSHTFNDDSKSLFNSVVANISAEVGSNYPGSGTVAAKLADILFVEAIRHYLESQPSIDAGWLKGLADPQISIALAAVHESFEYPWTVELMAKEALMSRSRFAVRFRQIIGESPISYITKWRMYQAAGLLIHKNLNLCDLSSRFGYTSEAAFSKAFKRWSGFSPAAYKRNQQLIGKVTY